MGAEKLITVAMIENLEEWRFIGQNVPQVEISGPYANQYTIFIQDVDGDIIGLKPNDARRLIKRLEQALITVKEQRKLKLKAVKR